MRFSKRCVKTECLDRKTTIEAFESKKFENQIVYESSTEILADNDETKSSNETFVNDDFEPEKRNEKNTTKDSNENNIQFFNSKRFLKLLTRHNHQMYCLYFKNKFERKLNRHQKRILTVVIVNAIQQFDHEKFMQSNFEYFIEDLKFRISKIYHNEIEIFDRKNVDKLFSHKKKNHEIHLTLEIEFSFVKNYKSMSKQELAAVKKYLNEHLKKKFIKSNSSKMTTSVLFVKKLSEGLKFCVNYRKLNEIIEKNCYSIFLISETLIKLSKALIFIKFDVITAFNKIKIKAGQK